MKTLYFLSSSIPSIRFFTSLAALITATLCGAEPISSPSSSPQSATPNRDCLVPGYDDHCERWVSVYDYPKGHGPIINDPLTGVETATAQAIGPYGKRVYVTGYSWDNSSQSPEWATIAVDAATGAKIWVARHGGRSGVFSYAYDVAVSRDGKSLYVTGQQYRQQQGSYFSEATTIAYDTANGSERWVARYKVPFGNALMFHVAVSPDGSRVYVSGEDTAGGDFGRGVTRFVTLAYAASTGAQKWVAFHDRPDVEDSPVFSMALDPTGIRLYVGGTGGMVAYEAATGRKLWQKPAPIHSLAVSADGSQLFAMRARGVDTGDYDLVSYVAESGKISWTAPLLHTFSLAPPIVADPSGARVYVATTMENTKPNHFFQSLDAVTRAFDARSGRLVWKSRYHDPRFLVSQQEASGLAISPDGKQLYLSAAPSIRIAPSEHTSSDISTLAYDTADGSQKWIGRYSASPDDYDVTLNYPAAHGIGVTPDGSKVILSGSFNHHPFSRPNDLYPTNRSDYGVIAYDTQLPPRVRALKAVSRKVHGSAGVFDLIGIESRSGGSDQEYNIVVSFPAAVTLRGAEITSGTGTVASTTTDGAEAIIKLTGVSNAQTITLKLLGVSDGLHTNDVPVAFSVLVGDASGNGIVTASDRDRGSDLSLVQGQSGLAVEKVNFREDVNADGVIDSADVSLVEANAGTTLP